MGLTISSLKCTCDEAYLSYHSKRHGPHHFISCVLVPDLFRGDPWSQSRLHTEFEPWLIPDLFRGDPWSQSRLHTEFEPWLTSQLASRVAKDIDTSVKWLANEFTAAGISEKLGIIGFCFGGGKLIETLARDQHSKFGTGVCFYGTRIDTSLARDIKVPVLFICGDKDHLCPLGILEEVEKTVEGSRVVIYSGRGHGFAHRPESQEEDDDAENAFAIMRSWLQDCLVSVKNRIV
ncbi:carboxymethylenebutenolidase homolog [Asparagus officinalis]|uniref:carboxymethylenebutenolidase homolog n=1 Tax=Asparagus officinalis TaxID=4686 RepID=UPI00098DEDD6|nr:carboxymethylenebutenolidase homolog [Asparagus officinalis]